MQGLWSLIGKIGTGAAQNFPYEIGEKAGSLADKSVWTLHEGKKKGTGEAVSVFIHDVKSSSEDKVQTAKLALRRLKTLRHPNIVRYIDGLESDTVIYLVTEPVQPLEVLLSEDENSKADFAISWGLHQITAGLSFLINDCSLIHGNVCMASVFVDIAGEWKLGGVDYLKPVDPSSNTEEPDLPRLPVLQVYEPPEGRKYSKGNKKAEKWSADMWGLGCLIWEVFNGPLSRTGALKSVGKIPKNLVTDYVQLVGANPKSRPNPAKFLQECRTQGHYLKNSFVDANLFLQELQIKEQKEQKQFFQSLSSSLDLFPQQYCKHRILPQLLNAYEYGSAGSAVLGPLFKVGKLLDTDEYQQKIVPCVVKLFSSTDRATRIHLLQQLDNFVQHLKPSTVDEQIFPHVALGFGDTIPAMREQTVKSMLLLASKLSEKTINNQLLKYFAKLQMDQEPGIRTNTTVCLGKIAVHLPLAVFKVIKVFLTKIEKASEDPESTMNQAEAEQTPESTAAGSSWTGWAVSSLTSKLYRGGSASGGITEPADKSEPGKGTHPVGETDDSKMRKEIRPGVKQATGEDKDEDSGSDSSGKWSGNEWNGRDWNDGQEPDMGDLKSDLLAAKEEIAALQNAKELSYLRRPANLAAEDDGAESGSDYGDWGENDDWSVDSFSSPSSFTSKSSLSRPENKKAVQQARAKSTLQKPSRFDQETSLLEMLDENSGQVPAAAPDCVGDTRAPKIKSKTVQSALKSSQRSKAKCNTDNPPQLTEAEGDAWDVGDWGSFEEPTSSAPGTQSNTKSALGDEWGQGEKDAPDWSQDKSSKAELLKKRREERRQRLQAQKDKRATGGKGPMKLGAVKMQ
ncbi:N-terminal kinase-like protein isoform X3 [Pocillopora damicornis]|uniref:N-terminal kinase-like protein isoform X3 n=1 Tax=Pocillopora damicornis TaxID=46731 RepID=UPI000F554BE3|nr:N-terminal kinase-like protein isoform X3 [Pocillopora damicornis]